MVSGGADWSGVVLVGPMGAGKSTVGRRLARFLGWRFVDVDREIELAAGRTIRAIFRVDGEAGFRALEAECTAELLGRDATVLSTGGGWVLGRFWPGEIPASHLTVWLQAAPAEVLLRLGPQATSRRPLLAGTDPAGRLERLGRLALERDPLYRAAKLHLDTGGRRPDEIARDIERMVRAGTDAVLQA